MQLKRILIPLLAIILVCLAAGTTVSAAEAAPSFDLAIDISSGANSNGPVFAKAGDTITVTASVLANPGVTAAEFTLLYNAEALEPVKVGGALSYTTYNDVFAQVLSGEGQNATVQEKAGGKILWRYLGDKSAATGKLVELTFKVKEGFHGDFEFALTKNGTLALNSLQQITTTATVGYAGVHTVTADPVEAGASCTAGATKTYHCDTCNSDIVIESGSPLGHNLVKKTVSAGSCTEDAVLVAHFFCDRCNGYFYDAAATMPAVKADVVTTAPGHVPAVTVSGKDATCDEPGYTERKECSVCHEVVQEQTAIQATGHTVVIDPAVEPTDGNPGLTEGRHCSTCGKVLVPQETIGATSLVWLWVVIAIVVLAAAGVVAYYFVFKKRVKRY